MLQLNSTVLCLEAPPRFSLFERLTADLPAAVKLLAGQITASELGPALLGYLRSYPHASLTASDIAAQIDKPLTEVAPVLAGWVQGGLVERQSAACMYFYRLTGSPERLRDLDVFFAWQQRWLAEALSIARAVGAPLTISNAPATSVLPRATVQDWLLGMPAGKYGDAGANENALVGWGDMR